MVSPIKSEFAFLIHDMPKYGFVAIANVEYYASLFTHSLSLMHSLTHSPHSLTHSLTLSHALTHSLSSLTHSLSLTLSHALTHSRTHSLTQTQTHMHTQTHALSMYTLAYNNNIQQKKLTTHFLLANIYISFGLDENQKVQNRFEFPANNLVITSTDIQSVEPVDHRTCDALQKICPVSH